MSPAAKKIPIGLAKVRKDLPPPGKILQNKKDVLRKRAKAELRRELKEQLSDGDCDHTLRHTEAFLAERGLDAAAVVPWLRDSGGYCDCEVLANVEDQWADWL